MCSFISYAHESIYLPPHSLPRLRAIFRQVDAANVDPLGGWLIRTSNVRSIWRVPRVGRLALELWGTIIRDSAGKGSGNGIRDHATGKSDPFMNKNGEPGVTVVEPMSRIAEHYAGCAWVAV